MVQPDPCAAVHALTDVSARTDILNRLRRAEGQLRGIQRMVQEGEDCQKIGQQFSAVRKALDSTFQTMTVCMLEQDLRARLHNTELPPADLTDALQALEKMLTRS